MLAMQYTFFCLTVWCCAGEPSSTCTAADGEVCDDEQATANSADGSSLIQMQTRQKQPMFVLKFPDIGSQWAKATDWLNNVTNKAQKSATEAEAFLSNGMATALASLGNILNRTLALLASETKAFQAQVMEAKGGVTSGVASLLKKSKNASVVKVPVGEKYEAELNSTFAATTTAWSAVQTSVNSASEAISSGLKAAGLDKVAATFNSTMQLVLTQAKAFIAKLQEFKDTLGGSSYGTALIQAEPFNNVVATANAKLQEAAAYVKSVPSMFMDAFKSLEDQILGSMKSVLNEESLAKVQTAFGGVNGQVQAVADSLANASSALIQNMQEGVDAAKPPPLQGAAERPRAVGTVVLSMSLLALLSSV